MPDPFLVGFLTNLTSNAVQRALDLFTSATGGSRLRRDGLKRIAEELSILQRYYSDLRAVEEAIVDAKNEAKQDDADPGVAQGNVEWRHRLLEEQRSLRRKIKALSCVSGYPEDRRKPTSEWLRDYPLTDMLRNVAWGRHDLPRDIYGDDLLKQPMWSRCRPQQSLDLMLGLADHITETGCHRVGLLVTARCWINDSYLRDPKAGGPELQQRAALIYRR